jgi:lysine/ornithine N-monooxygenase
MHEFRTIDQDLYRDKTILVIGTSISAYDYLYHIMMSPWKADIKNIYIIGKLYSIII